MMTAPCSLNTEPYLTEWHADLESGMEIWIQTSETEEMKWVRLGSLYEKMVNKHKECPPTADCACNERCCSQEIALYDVMELLR